MAWDDVRNAFSAAWDGATAIAKKCYDRVTGQITLAQANAEFKELSQEKSKLQEEAKTSYDRFWEGLLESTTCINTLKVYFCKEAFPRFQRLGAQFAQWEVYGRSLEEKINELPQFESSEFKEKDKLLLIDFEEHWFRDSLKLLIPGLSYCQAKESLELIQKEKDRLPEEKERLSAWEEKTEKSLTAMTTVADIFRFFGTFYDRILVELDYSIHMVKSIRFFVAIDYFDEEEQKIDICILPQHHFDCLMAAEKTTRIVCDMVSRHYIEKKAASEIPELNAEDQRFIERANSQCQEMEDALKLEKEA